MKCAVPLASGAPITNVAPLTAQRGYYRACCNVDAGSTPVKCIVPLNERARRMTRVAILMRACGGIVKRDLT